MMTTRSRKILFGFALFGTVLLIGVGAGLVYLQTEKAGGRILARINTSIPGMIRANKVRLALTSGTLEIHGLVIEEPSGKQVASSDRLFLKISLWELLTSKLHILQGELESPKVDFIIGADGSNGLIGAFAEPSEKETAEKKEPVQEESESGFNLIVESLDIRDGQFLYEDKGKNLRLAFENIGLRGSGNLVENFWDANLDTGKVSIGVENIQTELASVHLSGKMSGGDIGPLDLHIATADSAASLSGRFEDLFKNPRADLDVNIKVLLSEIARAVKLEKSLEGTVSVLAKVDGSLNDPNVTVNVGYSGGDLFGVLLEKSSLDATLADRSAVIDTGAIRFLKGAVDIQGEVNLKRTFPDGFLSSVPNWKDMTYALALKISELVPAAASQQVELPQGVVNGTVSAAGSGLFDQDAISHLNLNLAGSGLTTGGLSPVDLHAEAVASLANSEIDLNSLSIVADGTQINAIGQYGLVSGTVSVHLKAEAESLSKSLAPLGIKDIKGLLRVDVGASGTLKRPVAKISVDGKKLQFGNVSLGDTTLSASMDEKGILNISRLYLKNHGSVIQGGGTLGFEGLLKKSETLPENMASADTRVPLDFKLTLENVKINDFISQPPMSGIIRGALNVGGDLLSPEASLSLVAVNLDTPEVRIGDLQIEAGFSDRFLTVSRADLSNRLSSISITGSGKVVDWKKFIPTEIRVKGDKIFLSDFFDKYTGSLSVDGQITETQGKPSGSFQIKGEKIDFGFQRFDNVSAKLRLDGDRVYISPMEVYLAPENKITGEGWVSLDSLFELRLRSDGVALGSIDRVKEQDVAEGVMTIDIQGSGPFKQPEIVGKIGIGNLSVNEKPLGDASIDLSVSESTAMISGNLNFGFSGRYHLEKKDFSAKLTFEDTDLSPYFKLGNLSDFSGKISGNVTASGNLEKDPVKQSMAEGTFSRVRINVGEEQLFHAEDFLVRLERGKISIPSLNARVFESGNMAISGSAQIGGEISIAADGNVPLKGTRMIAQNLPDIEGDLEVSAKVGGTMEKPAIQATVRLKEVGFTIPELLQRLHGINGVIEISPESITVEKLTGMLDSGKMDLSGTLALRQFQPQSVNLTLAARAVPVKIPDTLDVLLQSDLTLSGKFQSPLLEGEVILLEGLYYKDMKLSLVKGVTQKKRAVSAQPPEIETPFVKNMRLNIGIKRRNPFWVDNNIAHLDVNPDLRIAGTVSEPVIRGRTTIESGTITYQRKTFTVQRGVIDFVNPYDPKPLLDIESTTRVRRWLITLTVSGSPENLVFSLKSDPPEEDGDILSLLVLGKTTRELIKQEGGVAQSTEQMMAELVASTFGEDIKRATGLDILEVQTNGDVQEEEQTDESHVKVTVGKNLSDRLTIKYSVDTKQGEMVQKAISEYKFFENILLSGFQDSQGIFGGELQFRLEFR